MEAETHLLVKKGEPMSERGIVEYSFTFHPREMVSITSSSPADVRRTEAETRWRNRDVNCLGFLCLRL